MFSPVFLPTCQTTLPLFPISLLFLLSIAIFKILPSALCFFPCPLLWWFLFFWLSWSLLKDSSKLSGFQLNSNSNLSSLNLTFLKLYFCISHLPTAPLLILLISVLSAIHSGLKLLSSLIPLFPLSSKSWLVYPFTPSFSMPTAFTLLQSFLFNGLEYFIIIS